ncbi:MAG: hypothetical protein DBX36_03375 [Oscillospiraceae bacterium]|nr:MAG: hypothetical protein DBX36_03375 [Oscillospiraceae bacterium]
MSDENKKINFTAFSIAALFIAIGFAAAQVLLAFKYFETDVLFYKSGAQLPKYFYFAVTAVTVLYLVFGVILNKKRGAESVKKSRLTALSIYLGLICGFVLISADVMFVLRIARGEEVILFNSVSDIVTVLFIVVSVPAAAYFIVVSFENGAGSTSVSVLGMFTIAWMALLLLKMYFTMDTALTSPVRILNQIAPMAIMFYLIQEIRYRLGCERPALFRTFSAIAMLIIYVTAALEITSAFMDNEAGTDPNLMFKLTEGFIGLYITVNTFCLPSSVKYVGKKLADEKNALKQRRRQREENEADSYLNDLIEDKESLDYDAFLGTSSYKMEKSEESDKSEEPEERKNAAESDNGSSLNRYNGIKEDMEVLRENSIKLKFSSSDDTETDDTITLYQADSPSVGTSVEDGFTGGFESGEFSATEDRKKIPKIVSRGFISSDNEKRDRTVSSEKMETDGDGNIFSFLSEEQNKDDFEDTGEHKKTDEDCNIGDEDSFDTASDMDYEDDTEQ